MEPTITNEPIAVSTEPSRYPASDFRFLRSEGIRWIQKLAAGTWTDHNAHDPGITILDLLCYAITDISYRLDFDMKDLLAAASDTPYKDLYSPAQVLTINPVTLTDFRKVLIDIEGVRNGWIEKQTNMEVPLYYIPGTPAKLSLAPDPKLFSSAPLVIKGFYRTIVVPEPGSGLTSNAVMSTLQRHRNLCEDFSSIIMITRQNIVVSGIVEIGLTDNINKTVAGMLFRIARFLSPKLRFYNLTQMLAAGKTIDEIFDGPNLEHGFIDDAELVSYVQKTQLHTSDIIREMMDEPGVLYVGNVKLKDSEAATKKSRNDWMFTLDDEKVPELDVEKSLDNLVFAKNGNPVRVNITAVTDHMDQLLTASSNPVLPLAQRDVIPPQATIRPNGAYYSIQHHFPQVYGLGDEGLPKSASALRVAQVKQLKAYLLFFEQILANQTLQAARLPDLFSFHPNDTRTYAVQSLRPLVPRIKEVLFNMKDQVAGYEEPETGDAQRRNRLLDHLLARFGENLWEYSLRTLNANGKPDIPDKLLEDKARFLASYPSISNNRGKAFNYNQAITGNGISGLQKRLAAKLGIENDGWYPSYKDKEGLYLPDRTAENDKDKEGFYLVEHILLRPVQEDVKAVTDFPLLDKSDHPINNFQKDDGQVLCTSKSHGLLTGDKILITQSVNYTNNSYMVTYVSKDIFRISAPYRTSPETKRVMWRPIFDQDILAVATDFPTEIKNFQKDDRQVLCTSKLHGLLTGDKILITQSVNYTNNPYTVTYVSNDTFRITALYGTSPETKPVWRHLFDQDIFALATESPTEKEKDPFSLQLTCVFPASVGRFIAPEDQQDTPFRRFVAETIRKETPAHLSVNVRWLSPIDLQQFGTTFCRFLNEMAGISTIEEREARIKENKYMLRVHRNRLMDLLSLSVSTYPLADTPVEEPTITVNYQEPARITLAYSQVGVIYRVQDETGTRMNDRRYVGNGGPLTLTTLPLTRDTYLFSIDAIYTQERTTRLLQTVSARIGININLGITVNENPVAYGSKATVVIKGVQSGTIYQLFAGDQAMSEAISTTGDDNNPNPVLEQGEKEGSFNLSLITSNILYEDVVITVKATNKHIDYSAVLKTIVNIQVGPDTALDPVLETPVVDYNGTATVTLGHSQKSTVYYLLLDAIDNDTADPASLGLKKISEEVKGTGDKISINASSLTEDLRVCVMAKKIVSLIEMPVPVTGNKTGIPASGLREDLPVSVTAKKIVSGIQSPLSVPDLITILVKPDPHKELSIPEKSLKAGDSATIMVSNTQRGVMYQLRVVNAGKTYTNVGNPGYHHKNYGIGKARIEIEFALDEFTNTFVLLPAGIINTDKMFDVLAIKATTRQQVEIGTIDVNLSS